MVYHTPRLRALNAAAGATSRGPMDQDEFQRSLQAAIMRETETYAFHVATSLFLDGGE